MPVPPARVAFVDVFIRDVSPLRFAVLPSPKNDPQLPTRPTGDPDLPEIIFRNNGHAGFVIHFELQGDTRGYFFPAVADDAVWSQRGTACPNVSGVWDVFRPIQVVESCHPPQRRILIAENLNPHVGGGKGQGPFRYNLRVTNGSRVENLDPPGDNTNGHGLFLDVKTSAAITLAVGGAAATALYLALGKTGFEEGWGTGTTLLVALTIGFAIAALLFRFVLRD